MTRCKRGRFQVELVRQICPGLMEAYHALEAGTPAGRQYCDRTLHRDLGRRFGPQADRAACRTSSGSSKFVLAAWVVVPDARRDASE
eukprot:12805343-Alexandrium_andersonii.AAC.1